MSESGDRIVRAVTKDGAFRVMVVRCTETARAAVRAQQAVDTNARLLGEMLAGAILVRETMAPGHRVQAILQGAGGKGRIVADSHPEGHTRGLVQLGAPEERIALGEGALLQVMRTLPNGAVQRGVVDVAREGGISGALMQYMQGSEQVVSVISVITRVDDAGGITTASGYVVQLLPELSDEMLAIMTARLETFTDIETELRTANAPPDAMLAELLHGMPFDVTGESPIQFTCQCSFERLMSSLKTLPRADLDALAAGTSPLEISCDYCGKQYAIDPAELLPDAQPN
jgi:molecular chaperone Hsp33